MSHSLTVKLYKGNPVYCVCLVLSGLYRAKNTSIYNRKSLTFCPCVSYYKIKHDIFKKYYFDPQKYKLNSITSNLKMH